MRKPGVLVEAYGREYLVTVREPFMDGSPSLVVSLKTSRGWDSSLIPPMDALRAKALAVSTISKFYSAICIQKD